MGLDRVGAVEVPAAWEVIHAASPQLVTTMLAYVDQIEVSLRPQTVKAVETDLRIFAGFVVDHDPALSCVAEVDRSHTSKPSSSGSEPSPGPRAHP